MISGHQVEYPLSPSNFTCEYDKLKPKGGLLFFFHQNDAKILVMQYKLIVEPESPIDLLLTSSSRCDESSKPQLSRAHDVAMWWTDHEVPRYFERINLLIFVEIWRPCMSLKRRWAIGNPKGQRRLWRLLGKISQRSDSSLWGRFCEVITEHLNHQSHKAEWCRVWWCHNTGPHFDSCFCNNPDRYRPVNFHHWLSSSL